VSAAARDPERGSGAAPGATDTAESTDGAAPPFRVGQRSLPSWAETSRKRAEHVARVAETIESFARAIGLPDRDVDRWSAAAWLHDALKDAKTSRLRELVADDPELADLPDALLHGPAAAERARRDGIDDEELLQAVTWHTSGHPDLGRIGRALYLADSLEPGRRDRDGRRARLRERVLDGGEGAIDDALRDVLAERLEYLAASGKPIAPYTVRFYNRLVEEA